MVGRIGRAHGILGEATIEVRTDLPQERFFVGNSFAADPPEHGPLTIETVRYNNGTLLLKFKECADRTRVETLRDTLLLAEVDVTPDSSQVDDYHVQQLIGLSVIDIRAKQVGILEDVLNLPGQDLLVIRHENKEILLPFVLDFVPVVDLEKRSITITPPSGLFHVESEIEADNE